MTKQSLITAIVKIYFLAAIAGSFSHIITAAGKIGLTGWEMWSTPFMIDGIAIIGLVMRSESFALHTRKIGFRTQVTAGIMSLIANVYAASNAGGMIYGVSIVVLFVAAEWLSGQIESAQADADRAAAEAAAQAQAELATKRSAAAAKAAATRKRKAVSRKRQTKALEDLLAH